MKWTEIKQNYPEHAQFLIELNKEFGKPQAVQIDGVVVKSGFCRPKVLIYSKKTYFKRPKQRAYATKKKKSYASKV